MRYGIHKKTHSGISFVVQRDVGGGYFSGSIRACRFVRREGREKQSFEDIRGRDEKHRREPAHEPEKRGQNRLISLCTERTGIRKRAGNFTAAEFFSDVSSAVLEERGGEYTDMLENKIKAGFDENSDKTNRHPRQLSEQTLPQPR